MNPGEALKMTRRLGALLHLFLDPRWLTADAKLHPVVQPLVLPVFNVQTQFGIRRCLAAQIVRYNHIQVAMTLEQLKHEPPRALSRGGSAPARRAPCHSNQWPATTNASCLDRHDDFVQMSPVTVSWCRRSKASGSRQAERLRPTPPRFVREFDSTCGHKLLNHTQAAENGNAATPHS
jgi:hypothetical protein